MKGINPWKDSRRGIANLWKREVGSIAPRTFADSVLASEGLVRSLGIERKLKEHRGCVNTICFNTDGSILLSGSDDLRIILWDWQAGSSKYSFHTGHTSNILNAQFMPWSNDASIITCAADGQVRHVQLSEGAASVEVLAQQLGDVHKMAIEPGSANTFYTCSDYGFVTRFDLRTKEHTTLFKIVEAFYVVELYSIAIDPTNPYLTTVAGRGEAARIYDIRKWGGVNSTSLSCLVGAVAPFELLPDDVDEHEITGLAFSNTGELLVSYCGGDIYLFSREQVNSGFDNFDRYEPKVYRGHSNEKTVKGVYFLGPGCEYVASGSDSGHAFIWRKRDGEILRALKGDRFVVNCIEPHPLVSAIATSGIEKDIKIWAPKSFEPKHSEKEVEMAAEMMNHASSSDGGNSYLFSLVDSDDGSFYGSGNNDSDNDEDDVHSDDSDDTDDNSSDNDSDGGVDRGGGDDEEQ